jgi:nephron
MVCSSKHTYPPAMISWERDGNFVHSSYDTDETNKISSSMLRIEDVKPEDNLAKLRCNSINQAMDEPLTNDITLNVLYGPDKLIMNGTFEVELGAKIDAFCLTDAANPSPRLRYHFDGFYYEPNTFTSKPIFDKNVSLGAFIVNGTFTQTAIKEFNNKELKCIAENRPAKVQQIVTQIIKVIYPADTINMTYSNDYMNVMEGTLIRVVCISSGGNPLPFHEWSINNKTYESTSSQSILYTVESYLELTVQRDHHNQPLECKAVNKVRNITQQVILTVSYLPSKVSLQLADPPSQNTPEQTIKAGTTAIFACNSFASNPEVEISWYKNTYPLSLITDAARANTSSLFINNKEYNTVSYLSYAVTSADHLKEMRCDVRSNNKDQRTMHGSMIMNVTFAPEIITYPSSIIDVLENTTFFLNLTARANPAPTYQCVASNNEVFNVTNGTLTFEAKRHHNLDFTCSIANSEAVTDINFKLNVEYNPSAHVQKSMYISNKGDNVVLSCLVDGNPLTSKHITWKYNEKPLTNLEYDQHYSIKFVPPKLSELTITDVRDGDDGDYSCEVSNKIGQPVIAKTQLRVKRVPQVLKDSSVMMAAEDSNIGRTAVFKCKARGYPRVDFKWKLKDNTEIVDNGTKYTIYNNQLDSQMYMSILNIHTVQSDDYGEYFCEARSEIGSTISKAILSGKRQPDKPTSFRVTNITRNTISLAWEAKFDGGDSQYFRIRYRKDTMDPTYKYIETEKDASTFTLDNLEVATRYIINIQSMNNFGTDGFLREPLIVQTDFGFNEINQLPLFNGNDLPLTIILTVCGVGTLLLLFNVALIGYFIKKRKKKGEADSTTDTNETEANTIEMFSPPPPYPDELNYHFDLNAHGFEDEHKPFVPHLHSAVNQKAYHNKNIPISAKYLKEMSDHLDYAMEYATPIHHNSWQLDKANEIMDDDVYLSSLRQIDHNLSQQQQQQQQSFGTQQRHHQLNNGSRQNLMGSRQHFCDSPTFNCNYNQITSVIDSSLKNLGPQAFPYERSSHSMKFRHNNNNSTTNLNNNNKQKIETNYNSNHHRPQSLVRNSTNGLYTFNANTANKVYQDLNEFKGHLV